MINRNCLAVILVLTLGTGCRFSTSLESSQVRSDGEPVSNPALFDAKEALKIIGGSIDEVVSAAAGGHEPFCAQKCHWHGAGDRGIPASKIQDWGQVTREFSDCLNKLALNPSAQFRCLLQDPRNDESDISPTRLGFFRAGLRGADRELFSGIFKAADDQIIRKVYAGNFPELTGGGAISPRFREDRLIEFLESAGMPVKGMGGNPEEMRAEDYVKAKAWILSSMDGLELAYKKATDTGAPSECLTKYQDPDFFFGSSGPNAGEGFFKATEKFNWQQKLLVTSDKPVAMFGCPRRAAPRDAVGTGALDCLAARHTTIPGDRYPEISTAGFSWAEKMLGNGLELPQKMRILKKFKGCQSTYWVRSSADGRFFAGGLRSDPGRCAPEGASGFVFDFANPKRQIGVNAPYDPGFFPDNEGFTFIAPEGGAMCDQRVLEADPTKDLMLNLSDPKICGQSTMGVYQHVGRGLQDSDPYLTVRSDNYQNDDGAYSEMRDPDVEPFAAASNKLEVWPFRKGNPGIGESPFEIAKTPTIIPVDYIGDFSISPSGRLIMARIGGMVQEKPTQLGYQLAVLDLEKKEFKKVASICMLGGKATMSFTERFIAIHHYPNDTDREDLSNPRLTTEAARNAAFEQLVNRADLGEPNTKGSSNIYVYDIVNQRKTRLTRMGPGQYALYPHFRADGWLYFVVRDTNTNSDYAMATDAAIRLEDPLFRTVR
jgi:hypothetical protein